jgi:hypothetical protein
VRQGIPVTLILAWLCVAAPVALAQDIPIAPMSTERPTVGACPDVIPQGSVEVEVGAGLSVQRTQVTADLPESFLRIGVTNRLEIRYLGSNMTYQPSTAVSRGGLQSYDSAVSVKALLALPNRPEPRSAILSLSRPSGDKELTSGSYDPTLTLVWTQSFPRGFSLNEVAQGTLTTLNGARRPTWAPGVAAGRAVSDRLTFFAEYAPNVSADHSFSYIVDGGLTYARQSRQQFDVRLGTLADGGGSHLLIAVGYSRRYDHFLGSRPRRVE